MWWDNLVELRNIRPCGGRGGGENSWSTNGNLTVRAEPGGAARPTGEQIIWPFRTTVNLTAIRHPSIRHCTVRATTASLNKQLTEKHKQDKTV